MPTDQVFATTAIFSPTWIWEVAKFLIILLAACYFFFSLVIVRQVNLMIATLLTETAPFLRAFAIIHAGLALGVIIIFIGVLFA